MAEPTAPTVLVARALTAAGFARYGSIVEARAGSAGDGRAGALVNDGSSRRHEAVPALDLQRDGGRAVLAVYDATARRFPFEAQVLERHRLSDQVFLPLAGPRRCVLLVAPAGAAPDAAACEAFVSDGWQGVRLAAGTWHDGLLALDDGPWAVLERRALDGAADCDEHRLALPLRIQVAE